jgi:hypothetical protein
MICRSGHYGRSAREAGGGLSYAPRGVSEASKLPDRRPQAYQLAARHAISWNIWHI